MSYHRQLGRMPSFSPTTFFAEGVEPAVQRFSPPGAIYSPYGWGPDFNIGMPFNYTHHLDYVREPIPGARRVGPMYDTLSPHRTGVVLGQVSSDASVAEWVRRRVYGMLPPGSTWMVEDRHASGKTPEVLVRVPPRYAAQVRRHLPWMVGGHRITVIARGEARSPHGPPPAHFHVVASGALGGILAVL